MFLLLCAALEELAGVNFTDIYLRLPGHFCSLRYSTALGHPDAEAACAVLVLWK